LQPTLVEWMSFGRVGHSRGIVTTVANPAIVVIGQGVWDPHVGLVAEVEVVIVVVVAVVVVVGVRKRKYVYI